jgi:cytochrome c peroxidase
MHPAFSEQRADSEVDAALRKLVDAAGGAAGAAAFVLPSGSEISKIPQDPLNPLTAAKVELGRLLFHETAAAVNPVIPSTRGNFSCASCHHADAGFASGLHQGISEGGSGFGPKGALRKPAAGVDHALVDVQPIASPPVLNAAWQNLMLWSG